MPSSKKGKRSTSFYQYTAVMYTALGYTPQAYHKHNKKQFLKHVNEGLLLQEIDAGKKATATVWRKKIIPHVTTIFTST